MDCLFQQQRGYSALGTGLLFLPMTALVAVISPLVPRIVNRFGRLAPIVAGQVSMAGGLIVLALLAATAPVGAVAAAMMLVGGGGGHFASGQRANYLVMAAVLAALVLISLTLRGREGTTLTGSTQ